MYIREACKLLTWSWDVHDVSSYFFQGYIKCSVWLSCLQEERGHSVQYIQVIGLHLECSLTELDRHVNLETIHEFFNLEKEYEK